jgi:hypothetical protein
VPAALAVDGKPVRYVRRSRRRVLWFGSIVASGRARARA